MIAEHALVTTMDEAAALEAAMGVIRAMGFTVQNPVDGAWLMATRPGASRPASANQLAFTLHGAFDRQRLSFAITDSGVVARSFALSNRTPPPRVTDLLTAMLVSLEHRLADGMDLQASTAAWRDLETELTAEAKRRRRQQTWVACGVVAGFIVLLVAMIALFNALA